MKKFKFKEGDLVEIVKQKNNPDYWFCLNGKIGRINKIYKNGNFSVMLIETIHFSYEDEKYVNYDGSITFSKNHLKLYEEIENDNYEEWCD